MPSSYEKLENAFKKIHNLSHLEAITSWDEAANMPTGGGPARGEALAEISVLLNQLKSAPEINEWVQDARNQTTTLNPWQQANLDEIERHWKESNCMPDDLVQKKKLASSKCEQAWRVMRADNDWEGFAPLLENVVELAREEAQIRADLTGSSLYDAMLEIYEPGVNSASLDVTFGKLKEFLPDLIQQIVDKQKSLNIPKLEGPFPIEKQKALGLRAMEVIGFDFNHGRLDVSHHPFCGGVPQDVRITTRYGIDDFTESLMGVIHESGHASYEQGLPDAWTSQPVGMARSMGLHESQSLLFEMQVGRSPEFIQFLTPLIQEAFPKQRDLLDVENLRKIYSEVKPGFIRVNADEVTYPAHVILRYEIEKDLIHNTLQVQDIPEVWNQKMQNYLGLSTEGDYNNGCMQDVHWASDAFGYFPTYTLGAMSAAQFFNAAKQAIPQLNEQIAQGQLQPLRGWLKENVWEKACLLPTNQLMEQATGEALNPNFFEAHLRRRYLDA